MLRAALRIVGASVMGFIEAVPVGATQLEIARRSLNGYLSSALMIVAGSVLSDAMYGVIALWGLAPFLRNNTVVAIFWLCGAAISAVLGIWAVRQGQSRHAVTDRSMRLLKKHNLALITGFSLAIANPFMIAYWLIGASLLQKVGLLHSFRTCDMILVLTAGSLGIGSYLCALAAAVYKMKRFVSDQTIRRITVICGIVLLVLSVYLASRAVTGLEAGQGTPAVSETRTSLRNDLITYKMAALLAGAQG